MSAVTGIRAGAAAPVPHAPALRVVPGTVPPATTPLGPAAAARG